MSEVIRKNLALLTLLAALVGALVSVGFRYRVSYSAKSLSRDELLREIEIGASMPVVAVSHALTRQFASSTPSLNGQDRLEAKDDTRLFIPDKYAVAMLACDTTEPEYKNMIVLYDGIWFRGVVSGIVRTVQTGPGDLVGEVTLVGSVYRCRERGTVLVASGVKLSLPLEQVGVGAIAVRTSNSWVAYPAAVADAFISFLLMVFIPTLTLSIMKAIVDSAQSDRGPARLFRYSFRYFGVTTLVAGAIGTAAGYVCYVNQPAGTNLRDVASVSVGSQTTAAEYDAHPVLNQLIAIVPTNPLGALSNPDGNKGLQVAFIAVILGILLAVIGSEQRDRAARFLKNALALIVKDTDLKWWALSDWADVLTPMGVFFISLKFCATVSYDFLWEMLTVILSILAALTLHAALLLAWTVVCRNWRDWFRRGLVPGIPGLVTALATSSSYAALPAIAGVPLLADNSSRRGVFDFCTTINKNGTTIYVATVASYVLFDRLSGGVTSLALVVLLLSGLASVATAGLPFAAVFGLRMVLLASGSPGGLAWAILPIDPLVDRFVTVLNVFANLTACSPSRPAEVLTFELAPSKTQPDGVDAANA